ncbi:hypothetical protein CDG81_04000 [Actinopolyspora erythraea]|uniref:Uncharacterized protein n=1 Tax=Actinopolyspora erythraea TaxID=414996 RepID=A0A099D5E9_9ACTN|nr:hypothetical protein CDG81_04000 [Actinopolyspora erythraea]KGI80550.1 hypothetical protein IL38_16945 [Actinopolyspora erythraea]
MASATSSGGCCPADREVVGKRAHPSPGRDDLAGNVRSRGVLGPATEEEVMSCATLAGENSLVRGAVVESLRRLVGCR